MKCETCGEALSRPVNVSSWYEGKNKKVFALPNGHKLVYENLVLVEVRCPNG